MPALLAQEAPGGFEVLVVDNDSRDGTPDVIAEIASRDSRVRLIRNPTNAGFAPANNRATDEARGEFVVTLNNDTVPEPGWLDALVSVAASDARIGSVASQMVFAHDPETIQSAGIRIDRAGIAWDRGSGDPRMKPGPPVPVFGASAGAALYRRAMLRQLGGFDPSYFMYLEDVDLAWRLRRAGWRIRYEPGGVVVHEQGRSTRRHPVRMVVAHHRASLRFCARRWHGIRRLLLVPAAVFLGIRAGAAALGAALGARRRRPVGPPGSR